MTAPIRFTIPGGPQGKERPRIVRHRGSTRAYTPDRTAQYESAVAWSARSAMQGRKPLEGPVKATVGAFYPIPASWSKIKQHRATIGEIRPTTKPDADNVAKSVLDALNGICYRDDAQIVDIIASKHYSAEPRVEVEIEAA